MKNTRYHNFFVDISFLVTDQNIGAGVSRVVRSIARALMETPPDGFRVKLVYCVPDGICRYASNFNPEVKITDWMNVNDAVIEASAGDIFLGLHFGYSQLEYQAMFTSLHSHNTRVYFVVHDLLPLIYPDWFAPGVNSLMVKELEVITTFGDGALCVSQTTADDLDDWIDKNRADRHVPLKIGYFHNGADIERSSSLKETSLEHERILEQMNLRTSILMVGTVEPRKGHAQALAALDQLWKQNVDVNLVIVGKQGWMTDILAQQLRIHPEQGRRLFWIENANDLLLARCYKQAVVLLMASMAEGFGLPLIEAARSQLPIIARDLPVFREIAGEHAFYFRGRKSEDLSQAIKNWLELYKNQQAPTIKDMFWLTWEKSTKQFLEIILHDKWYQTK